MYLPVTYPTSFLCVMISDWCAENDIGFFQHSAITNSYTRSTFRIKTFSVLFEDVLAELFEQEIINIPAKNIVINFFIIIYLLDLYIITVISII